MTFIECECPFCNGTGCTECNGTGIVGKMSGEELSKFLFPTPTEFGLSLRKWRLEQGYTFRQLSELVGISPGTLSEIENGRREPTDEQRKKIEEVMRSSELKPCPACGGLKLCFEETELTCRVSCCTKGCWMEGPMKEWKASAIAAWNALPRPLHWTKETPTEPGWYWLRQASTKELVQIVRACGEELPEYWKDAEWAGPIQEPVEE